MTRCRFFGNLYSIYLQQGGTDAGDGTLGRANVRMWGNRIHNAVHNGISFQPQLGGPW